MKLLIRILHVNDIVLRTINKSRRNIPAAAGSADEATTSTVGGQPHVNGGSASMNGVSGDSDEDMDVN